MTMQNSSCNEACAGGAVKRLGRLFVLAAAAVLSCSLAGCQSDSGWTADSRADDRIDRVEVERADVYRNPSMTYGVPQDVLMYGYLDEGIGFYQDSYWGD